MYALSRFLHVLVFVYWLGGDLGAFVASFFVTDPNRPLGERGVALRILSLADALPTATLLLTLPSGVLLAQNAGWWHPPHVLVPILILMSVVWVPMALVLHFDASRRRLASIARCASCSSRCSSRRPAVRCSESALHSHCRTSSPPSVFCSRQPPRADSLCVRHSRASLPKWASAPRRVMPNCVDRWLFAERGYSVSGVACCSPQALGSFDRRSSGARHGRSGTGSDRARAASALHTPCRPNRT